MLDRLIVAGVATAVTLLYWTTGTSTAHASYNQYGPGAAPGVFTETAAGQALVGAQYKIEFGVQLSGDPDFTIVDVTSGSASMNGTTYSLDTEPYWLTFNLVTEPCSATAHLKIFITQTLAPAGYQLDATPRTYECTDSNGWQGLADGNIHYVMQPQTTTTSNPAAPVAAVGQVDTLVTGITIPSTTGVEYLINGNVVSSGLQQLPPGNYTVTARALPGFTLPSGALASWSITIPAAPTATVPALANTGSAPYAVVAGALALVAVGVWLLRFRR